MTHERDQLTRERDRLIRERDEFMDIRDEMDQLQKALMKHGKRRSSRHSGSWSP